ncbi:MAG: ABC transporter permease [Nitrospirae bacterium]|nr:MAG: ABC transporter permease [Nitrospirota bacterium]
MSLRSYLVKRVIYTIVLIVFVIVLNWIIFEAMPGQVGALYSCLGQVKLSPTFCENQLKLFGYGESPWVKFVDYFKAMVTFNFGYSYQYNAPVTTLMINQGRLANTLLLLGASTVFSIVIGTVIGIIISRKRGSALDNFWVTSSLTTFSLPTFFMGILLIFIFAIALNWFPPGNVVPYLWNSSTLPSLPEQILIRMQYLFLPALTLTLFSYGGFLLLTRATMGEALSEDYILTARAKGLSERAVLFKHAFKNASLPIITSSALAFGGILSGAIITETIFNWNGLGLWLYSSIQYKDFPVMEAMFFIIALCVIAANFVSDILYGVVDPRIRYE